MSGQGNPVVDAYGIERPHTEIIHAPIARKVGEREVLTTVPLYTAVGFAVARIERMLNPQAETR